MKVLTLEIFPYAEIDGLQKKTTDTGLLGKYHAMLWRSAGRQPKQTILFWLRRRSFPICI